MTLANARHANSREVMIPSSQIWDLAQRSIPNFKRHGSGNASSGVKGFVNFVKRRNTAGRGESMSHRIGKVLYILDAAVVSLIKEIESNEYRCIFLDTRGQLRARHEARVFFKAECQNRKKIKVQRSAPKVLSSASGTLALVSEDSPRVRDSRNSSYERK